MTIIHVRPNDCVRLQSIASLFSAEAKVVTVTGAGISTNAGIPDFRSKNGIYSLGSRHLFHSSVLCDPERRPIFYKDITKMRQVANSAIPTRTHNFIRDLRDAGKLLRAYTQNIDCLEEKAGLSTNLRKGPGSRSRPRRKHRPRRVRNYRVNSQPRILDDARGVECVLLHGSLRLLRCFLCSKTYRWDEGDREAETLLGQEPLCPGCAEVSAARAALRKRATAIGTLRPDIVLYDERDPRADSISTIVQHDLSLRPDVLLIMGTSLTTDGVKFLIKDFAKVVHGRGGKVVFVNLTKPAEKTWTNVIDYWVEWNCDAWVEDLMGRRPAIARTAKETECATAPPQSTSRTLKRLGSRENPVDLTLI
ncbi:DHS-like NAD/FAD-binding domain-containing protein [Podospora didyma]|uniref:DHS-like NAD/FAD-binding domain-containing protein n=1 Tax=Podospora didyma TaxID=330526 RepID=A0AAE0NBK2_9PEZI|nr:DHS-like NAD/FAD-binding domain-containing protein [Podospora didyma]